MSDIMLLILVALLHFAQASYSTLAVYMGCCKDGLFPRQLEHRIYEDNNNTRERCITACSDRNFIFSGTEDSDECWCGNETKLNWLVSETECMSTCTGNKLEYCGGVWWMSLYSITRMYDVTTQVREQTTLSTTTGITERTARNTSSDEAESNLTLYVLVPVLIAGLVASNVVSVFIYRKYRARKAENDRNNVANVSNNGAYDTLNVEATATPEYTELENNESVQPVYNYIEVENVRMEEAKQSSTYVDLENSMYIQPM